MWTNFINPLQFSYLIFLFLFQIDRHIGNDKQEEIDILNTLGFDNLDDLVYNVVPDGIRLPEDKFFSHRGKTI